MQPGFGKSPIAFGRGQRDAERVGCLRHRQAREETELDQVGLGRLHGRQFRQGLVQSEDVQRRGFLDGAGGIDLILRKGDQVLVKGQKHTVTAFTVLSSVVGVTGQSRSFDASGAITLSVTCSDGTRAILAYQRP